MKLKTVTLIIITLIAILTIKFSIMESIASTAVVPISITVNGKIVVTDANDDNKKGGGSTLDQSVFIYKSGKGDIYSGDSSLRIRSNLKRWQLLTNRPKEDSKQVDTILTPANFFIVYYIDHAKNANPGSASLVKNFKGEVPLSNIPAGSPVLLLEGKDKTSIAVDPSNANNWIGLNVHYTYYPKKEEFHEKRLSTLISYSVVSP